MRGGCAITGLLLGLFAGQAAAQQMIQEGFEAKGPLWKPGSADAVHKVLLHELTNQFKHGGQRSEHIRVQITRGKFLHFVYDLPPAPINDELNLSLWIKSNRPGVQLLCRVVLPRERDPSDPNRNMTLLVPCEPYKSTQWDRILLVEPIKGLQAQQRLLNHKLRRDLNVSGAYIDQLVLNVLSGTGTIDVWLDDLEVGPVLEAATRHREAVRATPVVRPGGVAPLPRRGTEAVLEQQNLKVDGKPFFPRIVRFTGGLPLKYVRDLGCNAVLFDESVPAARIAEAARLGLRVVPALRPTTDPAELAGKMRRFLEADNVLAWYLGTNLDASQFTKAAQFARMIQQGDSQRLLMADVWDGYRGYSRSLDNAMLGTHRWPLFTSMELSAYREWLVQRRRLARSTTSSWAWVQTHMPGWFARLAYPGQGEKGLSEPTGPLPEQVRLLAYVTLAAGYRGLAFWSDRYLADSHHGQDRLLGLALLNQELKLIERILLEVKGDEGPEWVETDNPNVKAAIFRIPRTVLVLPIWVGPGSQYVPGQSASAKLEVRVPAAPTTGSAWEITAGRVRHHAVTKSAQGALIQLNNFSLCTALVLTSDLREDGMVVHLQGQQQREARLAAQWLYNQAKVELAKVERVQARIAAAGGSVPDAQALLESAKKALARSERLRVDRQHGQAYDEAEVALRSLRVLMRASWERAVRDLDVPASSPYAASYFTLPAHWQLLDEIKGARLGANALPNGDFEVPPGRPQTGWGVWQVPTLDAVEARVDRVSGLAHDGQQCARIRVVALDPKRAPAALERTCIALQTPVVKFPPGALVRVSAWLRAPQGITASADGALFYDSVGGEPLAVRLTAPMKWKRFCLFRRVPASGEIKATFAVTGLGTLLVDGVKIEPLIPGASLRASR